MKGECKFCKENKRREKSLFCSHECKIKWIDEGTKESKKRKND